MRNGSTSLCNVQPEIWKSKTFPKSWIPNCPAQSFPPEPQQTPQRCRCCCRPRHSPCTLTLFLQISIWKILSARVHFQIHNLQKLISPPHYGRLTPELSQLTEAQPLLHAKNPAERAPAVPRRDQNTPRLPTKSSFETLLWNHEPDEHFLVLSDNDFRTFPLPWSHIPRF